MRSPLTCLFLLVPALFALSCTKTKTAASHPTDTAGIIGTWTWAYQSKKLWFDSTTTSLTPANTGISRTVTFDTSGRFTFIHNDSIYYDSVNTTPNYLLVELPVRLLPDARTDTGFYQKSFGIVGCTFTDTTTLTLQNVPYQAYLTADTLIIHQNPCLSRIVDIYIRKN
jgi:hypothetical protein